MRGPPTLIVVPCYNERDRLDLDAFRTFARTEPDVGFLFVDDGSADGTGDFLADGTAAAEGRLSLLRLDRNRGKGEAVRAGLRAALQREPRVVGFWDADLATPLDELPRFLERMEDDPDLRVLLGSRVKLLGRTIHRNPWRHYIGRVFATMASLALDMPVYDTQCGAKLFRVGPELEAVLEEPFGSRWVFDVELLGRLKAMHGSESTGWVAEQPVQVWRDVAGSSVRPHHLVGATLGIARVWRERLRPGPASSEDTGAPS